MKRRGHAVTHRVDQEAAQQIPLISPAEKIEIPTDIAARLVNLGKFKLL
jgi:hypothetical protein